MRFSVWEIALLAFSLLALSFVWTSLAFFSLDVLSLSLRTSWRALAFFSRQTALAFFSAFAPFSFLAFSLLLNLFSVYLCLRSLCTASTFFLASILLPFASFAFVFAPDSFFLFS